MGRAGYDHVNQPDYEAIAGPDWPTWLDWCQGQPVPDFVLSEIDAMLVRPVDFQHPTFCVLPFYAQEFWAASTQTDRKTFCCLVPDGTSRQLTQQDMLAGRRPQACQACWNLEDQGLISDRQIKNRSIDAPLLEDIQGLLAGHPQRLPIRHYKIDGNNTCNGTCVMCNSEYSSAWAQLERNNGVDPTAAWRITADTLDSTIDYATAASVGFRGGEPFLSDTTWHVLERLLKANNTGCAINFTTNGSITLTAEQQHMISRFSSVGFNFSIDGVGPVFEYVRYPLRWSDLLANIEYCRRANILITASYTITNLNVLYHGQTSSWFEQNNITYSLNPVYHPSHFRPGALPQSVKQHILQQPDPVTQWLLGTHTAQDDLDYQEFRRQIAQQDGWKGISLADHLPELAHLLG